jgi:hypothetical protein
MNKLSMLASLGVIISGGPEPVVLPETSLVAAFKASKDDYRTLVLVHTWVQKNHDLIHTEALQRSLKQEQQTGLIKLIAGALYATEQKRFSKILELAETEKTKPELNKYISMAAEIGQCKEDPSYAKFGLKVSEIDLAPERKFRTRESMLEQNAFFYCRVLFGVNWRADVAASFLLNKALNPTEVSQFLGCSYDAAYRNFHDLKAANWGQSVRDAVVKKGSVS